MNEWNSFRFDLWLYNQIQRKGWTMKELAEKAEVSESTIKRCIHNEGLPTMLTLELILKALGMHIEFAED